MKAVKEMRNVNLESLTWLSKCLTALLLCGSAALSVQAGGLDGGGGQVLLCKAKKTGKKYYQLYDYWKADAEKIRIPKKDFEAPDYKLPSDSESEPLKIDYRFTGKNYRKRLEVLLTRLERLSSVRAKIYRNWAESFESEAHIDRKASITYMPDGSGFVPDECEKNPIVVVKQMSPQFPGEKRYSINGKIWDELDQFPIVKAGLMMHELIYREVFLGDADRGSNSRQTGARPVQYMNAIFSSLNFIEMTPKQFLKSMMYADPFFVEIPNGFPIFNAGWDDLIPNHKYLNDHYNYHAYEYLDLYYYHDFRRSYRKNSQDIDDRFDRYSDMTQDAYEKTQRKRAREKLLLSLLLRIDPVEVHYWEMRDREWGILRLFSSPYKDLIGAALKEQDPAKANVSFFSYEEQALLVRGAEGSEAWASSICFLDDGIAFPQLNFKREHSARTMTINLFGKTITLEALSKKKGVLDYFVSCNENEMRKKNVIYEMGSYFRSHENRDVDPPAEDRFFAVTVNGEKMTQPINKLQIDFTARKFRGFMVEDKDNENEYQQIEDRRIKEVVFEY